MITTNIQINEKSIEKKLDNLIDDTVMLEIHKLFAELCEPYVPMNTGKLLSSVNVTPQYVQYATNYASDVYNRNDSNFNTEKHSLATGHWDKAMMQDRGEEFIQKVKELLIRRAKQLYG